MSCFEPVVFTWGGVEYTVKSDKVFELIEIVESRITLRELMSDPPFTKIAKAYCAALKFAGVDVSHEEVYKSLFGSQGSNIRDSISALIHLIIPPAEISEDEDDALPKKKTRKG